MEHMFTLAGLTRWMLLVGLGLFGVGAVYGGLKAYFRYRGKRVVTCPEYGGQAAVEVGAARAGVTAAILRPELRLARCSRWPEKQHCGQVCLDQIESAPESTLVSTVVSRWYRDKRCVYCGKPFAQMEGHPGCHAPVPIESEGRSVEWRELPAAILEHALTTDQYVCWDCHIIETLRSKHLVGSSDEAPKADRQRSRMH